MSMPDKIDIRGWSESDLWVSDKEGDEVFVAGLGEGRDQGRAPDPKMAAH